MQEKARRKPRANPKVTFSFKPVKPLTDNQAKFISAWYEGNNVVGHGTAGTGKTYIALGLALEDVLVTRKFERIIIVRSSVQSRDQGFLPGTEEEKMAKFEEPYRDITSELFEDNTIYQKLKAETKIIFRSTSCIRGLTWNNAAVVVDEVENLGYHEIGSVITRLGNESRIMFVGDTKQTDLRRRHDDECGLPKLLAVTRRMPSMREVIFNKLDIVRGGVVREWIIAEEELSS